ncbi:zinc finger protein 809-like isoform X2 [Ambystoma mexicanum]|uniref:zinc finger protein 809-like isoform X2 n=1 Tax=Ambystoma mexicanum TaxID=8296 RepID=UPI0037E84529
MPNPDTDEFSNHDASAYFSDEEWKLLQKWQKELYMNVMKEIHLALISLGPLITNTVFSLRAKERQELFSADTQVYEGRHSVNVCPEPASILLDHLGVEVGEQSSDSTGGHEIISFLIKSEDTYCMDPASIKETESASRPVGYRSTYRQKKVVKSAQRLQAAAFLKANSGLKNKKSFENLDKGPNSRINLWCENYQPLKRETTYQCDNEIGDSELINLNQGSGQVCVSPKHANESHLSNSPFQNVLPSTQQHQQAHACTERETSDSLNEDLLRHMGSHAGPKPFMCGDCGKSFVRKTKLAVHQRIHTGDKPYECMFCHKTFSRKDNLNGHMRIHTGEKPYKCTHCEKRFTWKCDLKNHQKKHQP